MTPQLEEKIKRDFADTGLPVYEYKAFLAGYIKSLRRFGGQTFRYAEKEKFSIECSETATKEKYNG